MLLIYNIILYRFETNLYLVWNCSFIYRLVSFTKAYFREITFLYILHKFKHNLYSQTNNWQLLPSKFDRIIPVLKMVAVWPPSHFKNCCPPTWLHGFIIKKTILHNGSGNFHTILPGWYLYTSFYVRSWVIRSQQKRIWMPPNT